jgi:hypothetical protein
VSITEPAATVEASDSWCSSCVDAATGSSTFSFSVAASSPVGCSRVGNAKPVSVEGTNALLRFFPREARGGNGASGTDSQGRGGSNRGLGSSGTTDRAGVMGGGVGVVISVLGVTLWDACVIEATDGVEGAG